jgi:UDP-2-acetamido-3-amino-2,3-dideoxy-glucuronate N-acetyltransferase
MPARIHPTAIVEDGVTIGDRTAVWDHAHVRRGAQIGSDCIIGGKTHIGYDVRIGNLVKINSFVFVCPLVTIEDGVMVSAGTIFTNDRTPRAATPDLTSLRPSEPDENTKPTRVCAGATIGAGCVIGCDLVIGRFAMVGMGSVVTRSVPDFHLVMGNPAVFAGFVCRCGTVLVRASRGTIDPREATCVSCGRTYYVDLGAVRELSRSHLGSAGGTR